MRYNHFDMLPENAFKPLGKRMTLEGGKGGSKAPDYTPVAQASVESAKIMGALGEKQLAENKSQYNNNMAVSRPVIQAQLGLMNQQQEQGDNYYNYNQQFGRPVEQQLYNEAMGFNTDEIAQMTNLRRGAEDSAQAGAQAKYDTEMQAYMAKAEQASGGAYFLDDQGNAIQSGDVRKVLAPVTPTGTTTGGSNGGNFMGIGGLFNNNTPLKTTYTPEQQATIDKQKAGYYQVETKDGKTVWVKSGEANTNPAVSALEKPTLGNAEADYSAYEDYAAKQGMVAKDRLAAMDKTERDAILAKSTDLQARVGDSNVAVYNRHSADIEAEAGQAVADSRNGFTNAINVAARQGLRYGFSPAKIAAMASGQSVQQAGQQAGAANVTRKAATETMYGRDVGAATQALTGVTANRNLKIQDQAIGTAKKQDVAGLYRNLPSVSQGSYNLATGAGSAAVGNQNSTSAQYMNGIAQGNGTIGQGQQMKLSGLSNVLNAQTSAYNANANSSDGIMGALGQVGGAAASAWIASDENIKKDIEPISDEKALDGIKKTKISKWKYDESKVKDGQLVDDKEHIGGMAQDLQKNLGDQVSNGKMVDIISAVGVSMAATKALAKKVDKLATKIGSSK